MEHLPTSARRLRIPASSLLRALRGDSEIAPSLGTASRR
jgi:hypothetical protein